MIELNEPWVPWVALLFGLAAVVMGIRIRLGHHRGIRRQYFNPELPAYQRNGALTMIPGGLFMVCGAIFVWIAAGDPADGGGWRIASAILFLLLTLAAMVVGLRWWFKPPEWIKPDWIRAEEQARREGQPVPEIPFQELPVPVYRAGWVIFGLALAVWWALDRPVGVLVGLAFGANIWLAGRPKGQPTGDR